MIAFYVALFAVGLAGGGGWWAPLIFFLAIKAIAFILS